MFKTVVCFIMISSWHQAILTFVALHRNQTEIAIWLNATVETQFNKMNVSIFQSEAQHCVQLMIQCFFFLVSHNSWVSSKCCSA